MALRFIDGFDNYQSVGGVLTGADIPNIGYTFDVPAAGYAVVAQGTSALSKCVALLRTTGGAATMAKQFNTTGANKVVIGFAMNANARDTIMEVTNVFTTEWLSTGYPKINSVTGTVIPILNTWYYYEFVINKTAQTVDLWLNGFKQFTAPITNPVPDVLEFVWGWTSGAGASNATVKIDDMYFVDDIDPTSKYRDRIGPMEVVTRFPTGNGTNAWAPTPSTKQNWQIVSQVPANTLEFVQSNTIGAVDTYVSNTAVTGEVIAVAVSTLAAKADVDNHSITVLMEQSGVQKESGNIPLNLQYTFSQGVFEKDVNGVDWTAETVNASRFGMKVK